MKESIQQMYNEMAAVRSVIESRLEEYAGWTIPSLFPLEGNTTSDEFQFDYQSFGAQATNHLSNKLMIGLFSASRPFFRLDANAEIRAQAEGMGIPPEEITTALQNAEKESVKEMARMGAREPLTELLKHLIVLGNGLTYIPDDDDEPLQVYSLRNYVVKRSLSGFMLKLITKDTKEFEQLPEDIRAQYLRMKPGTKDVQKVDLFTYIKWDSDRAKYIVTQHIDDIQITEPGKEGIYPANELPWLVAVWRLVRGEDYGRGLVEDYSGDFNGLSATEQSINEIMGMLAMIRGLVDPTGVTDVGELNDSVNGQWVAGREQDVSILGLEKTRDLAQLTEYAAKKERRLARAFLMDTDTVRDAERVTAEEIRLVARDLETALGGVYARLAQTLQLPLARLILRRLDLNLGDGKQIEPIIITGLDALSRSGDLESWRMFVADATLIQNLPPELIGDELNVGRILRFIAASNSLDQSVAFNTPEEKAAIQQQRAQAQQQAVDDEVLVKAAPQALQGDN